MASIGNSIIMARKLKRKKKKKVGKRLAGARIHKSA
jgi:hypothetical protein